jgi:hypothetical protein
LPKFRARRNARELLWAVASAHGGRALGFGDLVGKLLQNEAALLGRELSECLRVRLLDGFGWSGAQQIAVARDGNIIGGRFRRLRCRSLDAGATKTIE